MRTKNYALTIAFFIMGLLSSPMHGFPEDQPSISSDQFIAVCSPEKLFPRAGETINLTAYVDEQNKAMFSFAWTVSGGKVTGQGKTVKWDFTGVKPGIYNATAQIKESNGNDLTCTAEVTVIAPLTQRGSKRRTGRDFLIRGEKEAEGYGLYSYFLLGSRPDNTSRERYLSAIKEYLRLSDVNEFLRILREMKEINVTYLPLKTYPGEDLLKKLEKQVEKNYEEVAAWVLDNYDYERAQVLLNKIEGDHINGPYIVSFLKPLSGNTAAPPYLYQDQSIIPPDLITLWIQEFIKQAAQEKFWEERTMRTTMLKMRVFLGAIGKGVPEIMEGLGKLIALKDKLKIG